MKSFFKKKEATFSPKEYKGNNNYKCFATASERAEALFYNLFTKTDLEFEVKKIKDKNKSNDNPKEWNTNEGVVKGTRGIDVEIWNRHQPNKKIRVHPVIRRKDSLLISQTIPSDIQLYKHKDGVYKSLIEITNWIKSKPKRHLAIFTCYYSKDHVDHIAKFYIDSYPNLIKKYFKSDKIQSIKKGLLSENTIVHQNKSGFRIKQISNTKKGRFNEWYLTDKLARKLLIANKIESPEDTNKIIHSFQKQLDNYYQ